MKRKNQGFILLITLFFIVVISLLLLASMQHVLLYQKAINKQHTAARNFYQLEHMALQLAQKGLSSVNERCVIPEDSPNEVLHHLLTHHGCSLVEGIVHYLYFIEDLGKFPCMIVSDGDQQHATHHQRISLLQIEEEMPISFLQIRFIAQGPIIPCVAKPQIIHVGVSSWRYLLEFENV